MCKKQEDFICMLEDMADKEMKTITKKSVNLAEPVEKMKEQFQNLDKTEREKLLEGSRLMFEDSSGAANQCQTTVALTISTLAAIVSALSLSVSTSNPTSETKAAIFFGVIIFIVLIGVAFINPIIRIHRLIAPQLALIPHMPATFYQQWQDPLSHQLCHKYNFPAPCQRAQSDPSRSPAAPQGKRLPHKRLSRYSVLSHLPR